MLRVADSYPSAGVSALGVVASAPVRRSLGAGSRDRPVANCRSASPHGIPSTTTLRGPTRHESRCGLRFHRRFDRCPLGDAIELPLEVDDVRRGDVSL